MNGLFADAGYWIAIFDPHDRLHRVAMDVSRSVGRRKIVTTQVTLAEFLNHFAAFGSRLRQRAVEAARAIERNPDVEVVSQSEEQFEHGIVLYASRLDKDWGLSDC